MPQSFAQVYLHIVFSTKQREPFFQDYEIAKGLYAYVAGLCNKRDCFAKQIGGYVDHIHILCSLSRIKTIADLVKEIKVTSADWVRNNIANAAEFHWQSGYAALSVGQSQLERVQQYILFQREHHGKLSFQDEFRQLLDWYKIDFNEQYVWD
ncbi:transposase [Planctomycetales bacterium]|nr:transposase [Planctomycetales bacterium]